MNIGDSLARLDRYCKEARYQGWDLFDGLNSRSFSGSFLYRFETARLAWIQLFKWSPINLRKIASVPMGYNPKGLGLFASGLLARNRREEARSLLNMLKGMTCDGFKGISWGYNFPWQARAFYVPLGTPNIVTTVFVANAFMDYYDLTKEEEYFNIAKGSCDFILHHMILMEDDQSLCLGYIPGEKARVHNANMLGASLLARMYSHTQDDMYLGKSMKAMSYSIRALTKEYFWPYGELSHHRFIDNFHTGFNLVSLKNWMDCAGDRRWEDELRQAYHRFLAAFWLDNGCPKYYHDSLYPIDIHNSAQGIVTCLKLVDYNKESIPMAQKIARWAIANMQAEKGYFYYQKSRWYKNKIPYIRWSQAWMFYGLSLLASKAQTRTNTFGS
ncbi:MAG: hypothetical protein COT35_10810 [Nitrospirae bacterium CG08_land_8_20_14_0_20_52_24]|nr:MAG: hypothetical protein COT35_10810 [Nitrospirae bacterium CG08_land_8_20_14_0_20_52_24]